MRLGDIMSHYLTTRWLPTAVGRTKGRTRGVRRVDYTGAVRYAEYGPSPPLAAVVACFWILEGEGTGIPEPILPDGRVEIVVHYGVRFEQHHTGGRVERQPASMIVGQMLAPISIGHHGRAGVAAIRLRPAAVRLVVGCSAAEITGRVVALEDLFGSTGNLRERLALARDDRARLVLLERWLTAIVRATPAREVDGAATAIAASGGTVDLLTIVRHGPQPAATRTVFADVGLAPKAFARTGASGRLAPNQGQPLRRAVACGYCDQPP